MKKIACSILLSVFMLPSAHAASLKPGYFGCIDEKSFKEMTQAAVSKDERGMMYMVGKTCLFTSQLEGLDISILDRGIIRTKVRVYKGADVIELIVPSEALP